MTTPMDETRLLLQRYLDGDLKESERHSLEWNLSRDSQLAEELAQLRALGEVLRHDTQEKLEALDFDDLQDGLMERLQAEGLVRPQRRAGGLFDWLGGFSLRPWLAAPAAVLVALALGFLLWPERTVEEPATRTAELRARLNDCVVEHVEAVNSAALVFEANPISDGDDPMTVIWLFENTEKGDPS